MLFMLPYVCLFICLFTASVYLFCAIDIIELLFFKLLGSFFFALHIFLQTLHIFVLFVHHSNILYVHTFATNQ